MLATENKKKYLYLYIIVGMVFLFSIGMSYIYRVSLLTNGLTFFAFFVLELLIPGYAITNLLKINVKTNIELLSYSVFLGYLLTFVEYFLCVPIGMKKYAGVLSALISIISIIYLIQKKKVGDFNIESVEMDEFGTKVVLSFIAILLVFESIAYAGCNVLPIAVPENFIEVDPLFWVRNTVRFFREFKVYSNYHWFTSAQLAYVSLVTGIRPIVLSFGFEFIMPVFMMVLGGYLVFSSLTDNKKLITLALFSLFFTFGSPDLAVVDYASLLTEPFALDYGMGMFLFIMYLMIKETRRYEITLVDLVVIFLLFALLSGSKANYAAIAVLGIGLCCIYWLCHKQIKRAFFMGLPILVIFILSYIFITNMGGYIGNELGVEASAVDNFQISAIYSEDEVNVYNFAMGLPFPAIVNHLVFVVLFLVASHPFVFPAIFYQIGRAIFKKKKLVEGSIILLGMIIVCVFIRMAVGMVGNTEEYFFVNAMPISISFVIMNWEENTPSKYKSVIKKTLITTLVLVSFIGWTTEHYRFQMYRTLKKGIKNAVGVSQEYNPHSGWVRKGYINSGEMEALEWLRDNLSESEVFASNNEFRIVECISERFPVEMYADFRKVADGEADIETLVDRLQKDKIEYIYYDKVIEGMLIDTLVDERLEVVFENEDSVIYMIQ